MSSPHNNKTSDFHYFAPFEKAFGRIVTPFEHFIHAQTTSGILLMLTGLLALFIANSSYSDSYQHILHSSLGFSFGELVFQKSLHHWINDGLMAIFFFMIGLEIKREILAGELADVRKAALPIVAAVGGMLVPALLYTSINSGSDTVTGWGIPMATDIAFAIGIIALLGSRVPKALLMFLVALAIVDDLGAVIVIALFYTEKLVLGALLVAALCMGALVLMNLAGIRRPSPYFLIGIILWVALLKSGVHATLAGVLLALTIPARRKTDPAGFAVFMNSLLERFTSFRCKGDEKLNSPEQLAVLKTMSITVNHMQTPLQRLESTLHVPVGYLVIPLFAFANAGIPVDPASFGESLLHPIVQGIFLGLVVGKFIGILGFSWLAVKIGIASLPTGIRFRQIAGVALLAGIGFTMSIFIAELGFAGNTEYLLLAKTGILLSSLVAGIIGATVLFFALSPATARKSSE